jgi:hypothetical protein
MGELMGRVFSMMLTIFNCGSCFLFVLDRGRYGRRHGRLRLTLLCSSFLLSGFLGVGD